MPEDLIKAKIVFDGGGLAGGVGGAVAGAGSSATMSGSIMSKRGMQTAVTIPITDVLDKISSGMNKLAELSPMLGAEFIRLRKGLSLMLMPIGDTLANWLRPMAQGFLESAVLFYEEYKNNGLVDALTLALTGVWNAIFPLNPDGTISFEGIIDNLNDLTEIVGVLMLTGAAIGAGATLVSMIMASVGGFTLAAAGGLAVGAALIFMAAEFTEGGIGQLIANMGAVGVTYGIMAKNPYVLVASALVFSQAVWGDEISDTLIGFGTTAREKVEEGWAKHTDPEAGGIASWFHDKLFGREASVGTELVTNEAGEGVLQLGEEIEAVEPILGGFFVKLRDGWNWLVDAFTVGHSPAILELFPMLASSMEDADTHSIQPTFLNMQEGINNTIGRVIALNQSVVALPNINRTITYTIRYRKES